MADRVIIFLTFGLIIAAALITQGQKEIPLVLMGLLSLAWFFIGMPLILKEEKNN